ncbi:hypothetical protein TrLO_g2197 [Triparma laevis f. longispina]|uniref:GDT1 family protein n=1 Tax=Triparma laevis f. longispina TaxID=1714387 RepID=A0A9W6ZUS2_9STRA|nr:hypothetical protein TrLO_g2197 [Triparma laevis f. longispina]
MIPPPSLFLFTLLLASTLALTFEDADTNRNGAIDRAEFNTNVKPLLPTAFTMNLGSELEADNSFVSGFFNSWAMIIATELGDKTFFIAAILCLKHARAPVFFGALSGLVIMTILSSIMGLILPNLMSRKYTHILAAILFIYFGLKLLYDSREMEVGKVSDELQEVEEELAINKKDDGGNDEEQNLMDVEGGSADSDTNSSTEVAFDKVFTQSLTLTFFAEWGDRSQIATIALASHKNVFGVTLGGCLGHAMCTGLACVGGRLLATKISEKNATVGGGIVFLLFGIHAAFFES